MPLVTMATAGMKMGAPGGGSMTGGIGQIDPNNVDLVGGVNDIYDPNKTY